MGEAHFTNVDEYISAQPETAQVVLRLVRSTLRKALPGAEEVISYKIPAYRLHGGIVLYFAGWKQHYSLYPVASAWSRRSRTNSHHTRSARAQSVFHSPSRSL
jgi:uncharacterized protein YdhG (YjbR/CyaY superfamily)